MTQSAVYQAAHVPQNQSAAPDAKPYSIYEDILNRTNGDLYIGVVGPVRTGKSTFITTFMEKLVLPLLPPSPRLDRMQDELPQSASGRSIMTTQPKFIPGEGACDIDLGGHVHARVRMVDSVGYLIPGALEKEESRMVSTPWEDAPIPFEKAARIGTRKVMEDHATIGVVVTTDGTISDLPRSDYISAEEEAVRDMKASGKPFLLVLNSASPQSDAALALRRALSEKYDVPVSLLSAKNMTLEDIREMLHSVLMEFPLREMHFDLPAWVEALPGDHWLPAHILTLLREFAPTLSRLRDKERVFSAFSASPYLNPPAENATLPGCGKVEYTLSVQDGLFNQVLSEQCGADISSDAQLLSLMRELIRAKKEYDRMAGALKAVAQTGYGLVVPSMEDVSLNEPELMKQGSRYGVRLRASAPTLHLIRSDVETEITPVLGTQEQSEEFIRFLSEEYRQDPKLLWDTNFFGKSLQTLVQEGLSGKIGRMPMDTQEKVQQALSRMLNEGDGGMICILL
ncbi:MAG: stage IV sporulation protein A [Clostridiales bacterium]|nr:stage IV sporulation protein A [Clostridiales bacterium]